MYFVLVVRSWSFYPRGDCCGRLGLVLLCHTLFVFACARGHTTLALCVPSGLRFVCLVAVVCSLAACGSPPSVLRGLPSYHHFFPRGPPIKYALIPSLFRSAVLVASCSSCVLSGCPHFLRRWQPMGCACSKRRKGGGIFGCWARWRCMCLYPRWPLLCTSILFVVCGGIFVRGHTSCSSCAPGCLWYVCSVEVVRPPVACGSLLLVTYRCPSYHAFLRANGLECREHRMRT